MLEPHFIKTLFIAIRDNQDFIYVKTRTGTFKLRVKKCVALMADTPICTPNLLIEKCLAKPGDES